MFKRLSQALLLASSICLCSHAEAKAETPCQWNYTNQAGIATATYCGQVQLPDLSIVNNQGYTSPGLVPQGPGTINVAGLFINNVPAGGGGGGAVSSVFGRTGAVVAAANDYNFNQLAGSASAAQMPAFSGDATSSAGATALTLATVNANVGTFQGITVNAKGLVTAAANQNYITAAGAPVQSVFGRTGSVVATTNDYSFAQLSGSAAAAQMPAFTGDATSSAGATALTLATVNANVGTFGSSTNCVTITVNGKGLVTAISQTACAGGGAVSSVFGRTGAVVAAANDYNFNQLAGSASAAQMPAFSGDATSSAGATALTLATVNANVGTFGSTTNCPTFTVNGKGLLTAASQAACVSSDFGYAGICTGLQTTAGSKFCSASGIIAEAAGTNGTFIVVARNSTLTELAISVSAAPTSTNTRTFTLNKNGSTTAITCQITGAATTCTDNAHSVSVSQTDLIVIQEDTTGTPAAATGRVSIAGTVP